MRKAQLLISSLRMQRSSLLLCRIRRIRRMAHAGASERRSSSVH
jgi:hypothetical protein